MSNIDLTLPTAKFVRELESTDTINLPDGTTAALYELSTTVEVDIFAVISLILSGRSMPSPDEFITNGTDQGPVYADHMVIVTDREPFTPEDGGETIPPGSFIYAALADGRFIPIQRDETFTEDTVFQEHVLDQTEALRTVGFQAI